MHSIQNEAGFVQLINDNKGIIIKICNAYCQNKNDREDLAQEMIYQLWRSGKQYNPEQRFSTWMYRVALNVAISFYRKRKKDIDVIALDENKPELENVADSVTDTEENLTRLQTCIHELKELERAIMILYLESNSYREIAEITGISETNVATRISRIKEKIKEKISDKT